MHELSIFVDESGDFGEYAKHSPYYVVTMIFHDQAVDISKQIEILNDNLKNRGYENIAVHTEPLIRREEIYENVSPNERRALFTKLYYFVLHCDIRYKTFIYEKIHFEDDMKLEARMAKDFSFFLRNHLSYFQSFDRVIVYYDNGQRQITKMLNAVIATELTDFENKANDITLSGSISADTTSIFSSFALLIASFTNKVPIPLCLYSFLTAICVIYNLLYHNLLLNQHIPL